MLVLAMFKYFISCELKKKLMLNTTLINLISTFIYFNKYQFGPCTYIIFVLIHILLKSDYFGIFIFLFI